MYNVGEQFRNQSDLAWRGRLDFKHQDIAGTNAIELRDRGLPLVRPAFAKEHVSGPEHTGERNAVSHVPPGTNATVFRLKVLQPDKPR
jgi:hypothetical protein